jgi:hypothetical protein
MEVMRMIAVRNAVSRHPTVFLVVAVVGLLLILSIGFLALSSTSGSLQVTGS